VLDIPNNASSASAIEASLRVAVARGLGMSESRKSFKYRRYEGLGMSLYELVRSVCYLFTSETLALSRSHRTRSFYALILSSHTLLSYTPLILSSHTLRSYTPLIHSSHTLLSYPLSSYALTGWLYPTITCQHRTGSCTYADLPAYWNTLVDTIEKVNGL
jgi:hypothetical protein